MRAYSVANTLCLSLALILPSAMAQEEAGREQFEKEVRPLLAKHCYECHSGSSKRLEGGLRLDHLQLMLQGGDSGPSIVPGKAKESSLYQAVLHETFEMPPKGKLPAKEIEILQRWIDGGAYWPQEPVPSSEKARDAFDIEQRKKEHWSWQPLRRPSIPEETSPFVHNAIDPFLAQEWKAHHLQPSPEATRSVLIRRLYLDLLGIPPTQEQLQEHLQDESPSWYESMVDQLLASPQFGVRFARHWLDLVRYAESRGHEFDEDVPGANHYRDYVIRAFNLDLPYDQFVREQLAGDMLTQPRVDPVRGWNESVIGTSFWHLGEWVHSPVDTKKDETDRFDNMIDVFSKSMLGLTVACSRCHDHKFDAIGTEDYYALCGFLLSSHYRMARFETDIVHRDIERERAMIREQSQTGWDALMVQLGNRCNQGETGIARWVEATRESISKIHANLQLAQRVPPDAESLRVDYSRMQPSDPSWIPDGPGFGRSPVASHTVDLMEESLRWQPFQAAHFDSYWGRLKARLDSTNAKNNYSQVDTSGQALVTPTFKLQTSQLSYLVRGDCRAFVAVDSMRLISGPLHTETLKVFKSPDGSNSPYYRWVTQPLGRYQGKRLHVEFTPIDGRSFEIVQVIDGPPPAQIAVDPDRIRSTIEKVLASEDRSRWQDVELQLVAGALAKLEENVKTWIAGDDSLVKAFEQKKQAWRDHSSRLAAKTPWESHVTMAMIEGSGEDHPLLIRGNHENTGNLVPRHFLRALESQTEHAKNRLDLAERLLEPSNPFVSRVYINRLWHHMMGRGIVPTTDDFGVQGQPPTHPELLDYLAARLIEGDWSTKNAIRQIVLSHGYRQSSQDSAEALQIDPDNRWLARARVRRLEAESIRDTLLSIAGRLDSSLKPGSVPVHLTDFLQGRGRPPKSGPSDGDGRRSIYGMVRRNFLAPMMTTFDTPNPFSAMGRRNVSSVPAQSLMLLNDPLVHDLARLWSERVFREPYATDAERIQSMYWTAFARAASPREVELSTQFLEQWKRDGMTPQQALQQLAHVLMNRKELLLRF